MIKTRKYFIICYSNLIYHKINQLKYKMIKVLANNLCLYLLSLKYINLIKC